MNFRNYFKDIFQPKKQLDKTQYQTLQMLNTYSPFILANNKNVYDNLTIRACIDAIAKNTAKLTPKVLGMPTKYAQRIKYLLEVSPNELDSRYDFFYKITSQLFTNNNAFIYVKSDDKGNIIGFYPVPYSQIEFLEADGEIYCKFFFRSVALNRVILPYNELIHLRRHYNQDDLFGSRQDCCLHPVMQLFNSFVEGFVNAVKASSMLRGVIKFAGNIKEETLNNYKKSFVDSYMQGSDGIGALDSKCEFQQLDIKPYTIDDGNNQIANEQVCNYYGVSEDILKGSYNEEKYNSFYNETIEPLAIQISEEFTRKIFTKKEIEQGNRIVMSASRLTFANNSTKMQICKEFLQLGVFTFNECREIFELEPVEGGDKRIVSLNYVDADKANEYQGVSENNDNEENQQNEKE